MALLDPVTIEEVPVTVGFNTPLMIEMTYGKLMMHIPKANGRSNG
jgi:hypothetical protein